MIFRSIKWRLQLWHGLILLAVLAGFGFTAHRLERANELHRVDQELRQRIAVLLATLGRPPPRDRRPPDDAGGYGRPDGPPGDRPGERPPPPGTFRLPPDRAALFEGANDFYYVVWFRDGGEIGRSTNAPANVVRPERNTVATPLSTVRARGNLREAYEFTPPGECVLVGRSIAPELANLHELAAWLSSLGAVVLVFGLAGGWWLASRAIAPIDAISATAVKISDGDLSQRISVAEAESELGRLAGVLNSTFARLDAAFSQQARFTADASHELRTPVSVILSQTQTALARERSADDYRETVQACQRAAQRMRQLIESLLELARLDAGQEPMKHERLDLFRVACECVDLVRPLATERRIEIHCELSAVECLGDAGRIGQVITNLLTNAIHFNREGGEVRVCSRAENGAAICTVADTGEGIPAEDLPHVFERFYRVDKSRSRVAGRSGLGLAICKSIVDAHRGNIEVSSQPGAGSTFTVKLPAS